MRIFTMICALAILVACESSGDRLEVPVPPAERYVAMDLNSLHATSPRDLIVGGYLTDVDGAIEGILLRSTDGGEHWRRIGAMTYDFRNFLPQALHFNDLRTGWVTGIRLRRGETLPVVLRTEDGGGHFRDVEIAAGRDSVVLNVGDIEFSSDLAGEVSVTVEDVETSSIVTNVYETRDGGRSFVIGSFKDRASGSTRDPGQSFVSPKEGFRLLRPLENGTQVLEFTADGGASWVAVSQFQVSQFAQYY
ncbi:MAG: hypothetical protein H6807_02775 [Planctomycetes bacterium]|nr:hypothetical protein [Planctomycetota bacterium]